MSEKKEHDKEAGICFDNISLTELRKLMGREGIGSLCRQMMDMMIQSGKGQWGCHQFRRRMMTEQGKSEDRQEKDEKQGQGDSKKDHWRLS